MKKVTNISLYISLVVTILLLVFSLYFGYYILWTSFCFFASVLVADFLDFFLCIKGLMIRQKFSNNIIYRNETVTVSVWTGRKLSKLKNKGYTAYYKDQNGAYQKVSKTFSLAPNKVGCYYFGIDCIVLKSFMGIFTEKQAISEKIKSQNICTVLPLQKNLEIPVMALNSFRLGGNGANPKSGGDDFVGLRLYVAGDPLNKINFKKSSTTGKILVNQFNQDNLSAVVELYIAKNSGENYSEICEAILAIYQYYMLCGADVFVLKSNGLRYEKGQNYQLAMDLAQAGDCKLETSLSKQIKTDNEYSDNISATVIDEFIEDFSFIEYLKNGSLVFLLGKAEAYKEKIEAMLQHKQIYVVSQANYLDRRGADPFGRKNEKI